MPGPRSDRLTAVRGAVRTLAPGYFALVMATGIVSIGTRLDGLDIVSVVLLWLTGLTYAILVVLFGWRLVAYPDAAAADLRDPKRAFGYFTLVAGTDVLGTRLALSGHHGAALAFLLVGGSIWLVAGYAVPWMTLVGGSRPRSLIAGANGTWFIWAVATQSVAVLAAALEPTVGAGRRVLGLLAVVCWSVGVVLYAVVGVAVAARLMHYRLRPADLTPPYWVSMGATAITVVAGASIIQLSGAPAVARTRDMIGVISVMFWAFGTWLIPALVAAGWWRHVRHRVPLRYEPAMWSIVFPLGMYGVAGRTLGTADHLPIVAAIGSREEWLALAAWATTFVAMLAHLLSRSTSAPPTEPAGPTGPPVPVPGRRP